MPIQIKISQWLSEFITCINKIRSSTFLTKYPQPFYNYSMLMAPISKTKTIKGLFTLSLLVLLISIQATAQNEVAIGSATTKSNAILWLNGNGSQGLILPIVTNKSAVTNPDKGMIVYDDSDNKVWYRNPTSWVEIGGAGTSSSPNLVLTGNQLQLRDGTTVQSR